MKRLLGTITALMMALPLYANTGTTSTPGTSEASDTSVMRGGTPGSTETPTEEMEVQEDPAMQPTQSGSTTTSPTMEEQEEDPSMQPSQSGSSTTSPTMEEQQEESPSNIDTTTPAEEEE